MDPMNRNLIINIRNEIRTPYNEEGDEEFECNPEETKSDDDNSDYSDDENQYNVNVSTTSRPKR